MRLSSLQGLVAQHSHVTQFETVPTCWILRSEDADLI